MTDPRRSRRSLVGFLSRLSRSREGGVAMIFALALPALVMMTVAGVDLHRASTVRTNLQDALDAATLAAARSSYVDDEGITQVGLASLRANLQNHASIILREDQTSFVLNDEGVVVADAQVDVQALVANIFLPPYGQLLDDYLPVGAHSEVMRSNNRVEVALVLDNTGSMAGARLNSTKAAATDLIDRLEAANDRSVEEDAVRISLVPFSTTVRVSPGSATRPNWLSNALNHTGATGDYGLFKNPTRRFDLFQTLGTTWGGCVEARAQPYDIRDTAPNTGNQATMFVPYFWPDTPDDAYERDNTWGNWIGEERNDYVEDGRAGNNGRNPFRNNSARVTEWKERLFDETRYSRSPRRNLNTGFGPNKGCSLEPLTRLTDDFDALRASVDRMQADGNTQIPMGAMWGWHTLSPNAPFGDGRPYGEERLLKIMILMTDGENVLTSTNSPNKSTYSAQGYFPQGRLGSTTSNDRTRLLDERLDHATAGREDLCGNMKDAGVIIYTVAVQVNSSTQALMRRCATSDEHYFNVDSASAIGEAFDRIAGAIENLRITR